MRNSLHAENLTHAVFCYFHFFVRLVHCDVSLGLLSAQKFGILGALSAVQILPRGT